MNNKIIDISDIDSIEPLTTIYTVSNGVDSICFNTEYEREEYIKENNPRICIRYRVDYLGNTGGKKSVMRITNKYIGDGLPEYVSIRDHESYDLYDRLLSKYTGRNIWRANILGYKEKVGIFMYLINKYRKEKEAKENRNQESVRKVV